MSTISGLKTNNRDKVVSVVFHTSTYILVKVDCIECSDNEVAIYDMTLAEVQHDWVKEYV